MVAKIHEGVVVAHLFAMDCHFFDMHRMPYNMTGNLDATLAPIDLHSKYFAQLPYLHNGLP